jgi:uncharacterized protein
LAKECLRKKDLGARSLMDLEVFSLLNQTLILLAVVVFAAYFCKATTAIGSAMILVPLGALLIGSVNAVVLEAILDLASGLAILRFDRNKPSVGPWGHMAVAMMAGTALGSLALSRISVAQFNLLLGSLVMISAVWFLAGRPGISKTNSNTPVGSRKLQEMGVCAFAGLLGGISGIGGPPMILFFGSFLAKGPFRIILTRLFLIESVVRISIYGTTGLIHVVFLPWLLVSIPALLFGVYVGNKAFMRMSEKWFPRVVGAILLLAGLRLLF